MGIAFHSIDEGDLRSNCLTRADAKDGVQWTKTDQAREYKYTSQDHQNNTKCSGNCACKIEYGKNRRDKDADDPVG